MEWGTKGGQQRNNGQAHLSTVQPNETKSREKEEFNREEIEKLRALLGTLEKQVSGTCALAHSGKFPISIGLKVSYETFANSWVIEVGATDHMTHSSKKFITYIPCPSSRKIATADGSLTTVAGLGDVQINLSLIIKMCSMFQNFQLILCLLKLAQDLYCNVIFHPTRCLF